MTLKCNYISGTVGTHLSDTLLIPGTCYQPSRNRLYIHVDIKSIITFPDVVVHLFSYLQQTTRTSSLLLCTVRIIVPGTSYRYSTRRARVRFGFAVFCTIPPKRCCTFCFFSHPIYYLRLSCPAPSY